MKRVTLAAQTLQQHIWPQGRNIVSRLASEQTRHSSAVGSELGNGSLLDVSGTVVLVEAVAALPDAPNELPSLSGVPSLVTPEPSFRQVVSVLRKFGSGHRSRGVWPGIIRVVFNSGRSALYSSPLEREHQWSSTIPLSSVLRNNHYLLRSRLYTVWGHSHRQ